MADALAGVILFLLGYFFCRYRDGSKESTQTEVALSEEEQQTLRRQTAQLQAFHSMMDYDETTAYGGNTDE